MTIEYKMDANGGFYAADVDSKQIEYAYPTSDHATKAKKEPGLTAREMLYQWSHITDGNDQPKWKLDRWDYMRSQMLKA